MLEVLPAKRNKIDKIKVFSKFYGFCKYKIDNVSQRDFYTFFTEIRGSSISIFWRLK